MRAISGPRVVLAVGILAGLANALLFPANQPDQVALASDVYYHAGRAALEGGDIYGAPPGRSGLGFRYPPVIVLAFALHGLLGDPGLAFAFQTVLNLLSAGALAVLMVHVVGRGGVALDRLDRLLVAGYALASVTVVSNLVMGQVNHQLALALAAGAVLLERDSDRDRDDGRLAPLGRDPRGVAGIAFGLAASVKVFPALVGAWLVRRRARRAVVAATATGLGLLGLGLVVFGHGPTETYLTEVLAGENAVATFQDGPDPEAPYVTVRRQLAVLAPWLPPDLFLPVGAALLAPVLVGVNRVVENLRNRLVALLGTVLTALYLFPLEPFYLTLALFPLVPLLYLFAPGTPRRLLLAGAFVLSVPTTYETVVTATAVLPLPPGAGEAIRSLARDSFGFALPTTYGVWLVLAACLLSQHRSAVDREK